MLPLVFLLLACNPYRTYPLLRMEPDGHDGPFEPSGLAVMDDGRMVIAAEGDATVLWRPSPDRPLQPGGGLDLLPLTDQREDCPPGARACRERQYRAAVRLEPEPIEWLLEDRRLTVPYNVEDLTAFGPDTVLGVTEYTTVGRRTGFRRDYRARSRRQTERLFVLRREGGRWVEVSRPEVGRLRDTLSDWGRAHCGDDMLVEGLAWDPVGAVVYVGLRRCAGPVTRVLRYPMGAARAGLAAALEVHAEGIAGGAGPEEGVSGLGWADGQLWATTAWDGYGEAHEAVFGGRLHRVDDGRLVPVDVPEPFADRPSAVAPVPAPGGGPGALDALVLFDDDARSGARARPTATVVRARTPRPSGERWTSLLELSQEPAPRAMGLAGLDLRWYNRDHRLSQLAAVLAAAPDGTPGGWTRVMGGLFQIRVGAPLGAFAEAVPLFGKTLGHNRQAVALTDLRSNPRARFRSFRARLSVVPRDRERQNPSVARLVESARAAYSVVVPLPGGADRDAGLVLEGVEIDTTSRADRGICLAALDLGVEWADPTHEAVRLQATIVGGLCNDFDTRGAGLLHGRTTDADSGVEVVLHFGVVEGLGARTWSASIWDQDRPGPRRPDGRHRVDPDLVVRDDQAQAHLHCAAFGAEGIATHLPRSPDAPPGEWLRLGSRADGAPPRGPGALSGFLLALDPAGFDPATLDRPLTEAEALNRNNYIHRYLLRVLPHPDGLLVEGGLTHGIHRAGLMRDNQRASALRVDVRWTAFADARGEAWDVSWPRRGQDPNLQPEDGFIRWSVGRPADPEPRCSPSW